MKEKRDERGWSGSVTFAVAVILLMLPFIYAASIGPVLWLDGHGYITVPTALLNGFYDPLRFVCKPVQPLENLLEWWVATWVDVAGA